MVTLTLNQIAGQVKYAGDHGAATSFATGLYEPDTNGPIMVAIAMAESGGITDRIGGPNRNGTYDYGLWQINGGAHPDLLGDIDGGRWKDPGSNMQMAITLFNARDHKWTDWASYNNGTYRTYLLQAQRAWANPDISQVNTSAVADAIGSTIDGAVDTVSFLSNLTSADLWRRVLLVVGGSIASLVALWLLAAE